MTDAMWVAVFATAPGTVTLSSGNGASKDFQVKAGVSKLSLPLTPGSTMHATLTRNGQPVVDLQPKEFNLQSNPQIFDYNAFVAFAKAK